MAQPSNQENRAAYQALQDAGANLGKFAADIDYVAMKGRTLGESFGQFQSLIGSFTGAITGAIGAVTAFAVGAVASVAALNPATAQIFGQELKNLAATFGVGLTPVVQQATATVREWAGILLPIMQRLAPLLAEMAKAVGSLAGAGLRAFGQLLNVALSVLGPFVTQIANIIDAIAQGVEVVGAFLEVLGSMIGFETDLSGLRNIVADLVRVMALFAAKVLAAIAGLDAVKKFRDGIQKAIASRQQPPAGAIAAPKDSSVGGIEAIASKFASSAFVAAGAGKPQARPESDILEDILKDLGEVIDGTTSIDDMIYKAIIRAWEQIKAVANETSKQVVGVARDAAASPAGRLATSVIPGANQAMDVFNWAARQFE